jgi:mannobiose 2-epimerase
MFHGIKPAVLRPERMVHMKTTSNAQRYLIALTVLSMGFFTRSTSEAVDRDALAGQLYDYYSRHYVSHFFPVVLDKEHGGYFCYLDYKCELREIDNAKDLNTLGRLLYGAAYMMLCEPEEPKYAEACEHGFVHFRDVMWDKENGGFFSRCSREGSPRSGYWGGISCAKDTYRMGFAISGLCAYYRASGKQEVLDLAIKAFEWIDTHGHDDKYGFYWGMFNKEGDVQKTNFKDDNYGMHFMEALTELYDVWPDSLVGERLREMIDWFFKYFINEAGNVTSVLERDGTKNADDVRYGHDVEIAYLLLNAMSVAGMEITDERLATVKKVFDFSYTNGYAGDGKGFYYDGRVRGGEHWVASRKNNFWTEAEGLSALAYMSVLFPDEPRYFTSFLAQWDYIRENWCDTVYGGWYDNPNDKDSHKCYLVKATYHAPKAMYNAWKMMAFGRDAALNPYKYKGKDPIGTRNGQPVRLKPLISRAGDGQTGYIMDLTGRLIQSTDYNCIRRGIRILVFSSDDTHRTLFTYPGAIVQSIPGTTSEK